VEEFSASEQQTLEFFGEGQAESKKEGWPELSQPFDLTEVRPPGVLQFSRPWYMGILAKRALTIQ